MKTNSGNFFEDFKLGQTLAHATPRTLGQGDQALYTALYGSRFALQSGDAFAKRLGFAHSPLDDLLVFHTVFGKSVPDISLNAVANLGYAEGRFVKPVYPGTTLSAVSEVIGLKENSNKQTGVVYVRTRGLNENDELVLSYVRWVMVRKRDFEAPTQTLVPKLADSVSPDDLVAPHHTDYATLFNTDLSGSPYYWDDYEPGEKIDHVDGITVEEAEHMLADAALPEHRAGAFQPVHRGQGPLRAQADLWRPRHLHRPCIVVQRAWQCGVHRRNQCRAPCQSAVRGRHGVCVEPGARQSPDPPSWRCGGARLRLVATKNLVCGEFPDKDDKGQYPENLILDFDYWTLLPRRL